MGFGVKAMVDSGATHNFVVTSETSRLSLKLIDDDSRIKEFRALPRMSCCKLVNGRVNVIYFVFH